jgi:Tfp pilus assembly protein FimT
MEMLVVVVIIGVLAGAAVVNLKGRQEPYVLRAAAEDLAGAIRYAQVQSRLRGQAHRVAFLEDMRGWRVEAVGGWGGEYVAADGTAGIAKALAAGVRIARITRPDGSAELSLSALEFYADGSGFAGSIDIQSGSSQVIRVEVLAQTGQVHVLP